MSNLFVLFPDQGLYLLINQLTNMSIYMGINISDIELI